MVEQDGVYTLPGGNNTEAFESGSYWLRLNLQRAINIKSQYDIIYGSLDKGIRESTYTKAYLDLRRVLQLAAAVVYTNEHFYAMEEKSYRNFGNIYVFDPGDRPRSLASPRLQEATDENIFQRLSTGSILCQVAEFERRTGRTLIRPDIISQVRAHERATGLTFLKRPGARP